MIARTRFCCGCLALVLVLQFNTGANAQEITQTEPGVYETRLIKAVRSFQPGGRLMVRATSNVSGNIRVQTAESNSIVLTYTKIARTTSRSRAFDYIDLMSVSMEPRPEFTQVDVRAPNPAPWNNTVEAGMIDLTITVPPDSRVEIQAVYFEVVAVGPFRSFRATESLRRLDVSRVTDGLTLSTSNQRVRVADISGDVSVETTNADLAATSIQSKESAARFRNDGGDILIDGISGQVNVKNSFGRISIRSFAARGAGSFIRGASSPISVDLLSIDDGQLVVSNRYEDIELTVPEDLSAYLALAVDPVGRIEIDNFPFRADLVRPNRLTLSAGDADASISATISGAGNIFVHGAVLLE